MLTFSLTLILGAVLGLCVGSFLNVVIYRVPKKESLWWPSSHCACGAPIPAYYNIPVLSWLLLRGKSACCHQPIPVRYPLVESLTGLIFALLVWRFYPDFGTLLVFQLFSAALLVAFFIDLDHMEIPDRVTIGGSFVAAILLVFAPQWLLTTRMDALWGFLLGTTLVAWINFFCMLIIKREGMGWGDAKLLSLIGLLTGWHGVLFSFFAGAILGTLFIVIRSWVLREGLKKGKEVPFGPMILVGTLVYLFGGWAIVEMYLRTL